MEWKNFTVGESGSLEAGQTKLKSDFLKNCLVSHIVVNNQYENQQNPNPDFVHNYIDGFIDRSPNAFVLGDKITVFYKNCNCK